MADRDTLQRYIAAGNRRKAKPSATRWTPAEHRAALRELRPEVKSCPFCGKAPTLSPVEPWSVGNAWGEVACKNSNCAAQPVVRDGSDIADERGPAAYIALAIRRWNRRASPSDRALLGEASSHQEQPGTGRKGEA